MIENSILQIANTQVGRQEVPKGSNWGPDVQKYLASVGIKSSAAWCMAFAYWCTDQACQQLGIKNPLLKTGGVLLQWQKSKDKLGVKANPQTGDIFIMQFAHGTGHTGIVESVDDENIYTIEGNSNNDGSRDGESVVKHKRAKSTILGYLRISKSIPNE